MFFAQRFLTPAKVSASSARDDQIAAQLRSELARRYEKRHAYPLNLDEVWGDPEFVAILDHSYLPTDRSRAFTYGSNGDVYELTFTNRNKLVVERGVRGVASRIVVKPGATIPPVEPADPVAETTHPE